MRACGEFDASRLAEIEFFGLPKDDLETYRTRVEAVTPEEAARVSAKYMPDPDQVAIVVVGFRCWPKQERRSPDD